ncbi:MAG: outer membrane protein assembly factor BamE [Gammaproteobacteria bacterium]
MIRNYIKSLAALLALAAVMTQSGCGVYKINVQQGNYIKNEKLAQLKVGMTKRQVQFLMGSPIVQDAFHPERWDYVFSYRNGRTDQTSLRNMTIFFDGDTVEKIDYPDDYVPPVEEEENETAD